MANLRWINSLLQPESDNGTEGEKLETIWQRYTNLMDLSLEYWRFNTEIHGFHNIQSEIRQNTEEIQRFK